MYSIACLTLNDNNRLLNAKVTVGSVTGIFVVVLVIIIVAADEIVIDAISSPLMRLLLSAASLPLLMKTREGIEMAVDC